MNNLIETAPLPQEGNRLWWEQCPMTYDWEKTLQISPGTAEWYDEIDRRFLDSAYYARGNDGESFARFLKPEFVNGKRVLEIGCGMGTHAELLARAGAKLTAIDQTTLAVQATTKRLALKQIVANVLQQDAEQLAFRDRSFDFVWTWGVIHHSSSTEKCIEQIARVLEPGGRLMMMVYYRPSLVYYLHCGLIRGIVLGQLLRRSLSRIYVDSTDGFYARTFNKSELRTLLSKHFHSIQITVVGLKAELYPIPRTKFKVALERATPDRLAGAILGRAGSMVVVEATRSSTTWGQTNPCPTANAEASSRPVNSVKVLHVIPSVSPRRGGPSFVLRTITTGLASAGAEVHVVTTDDSGPERAPLPLQVPVPDGPVIYRYFPRQLHFYTFSWPLARWLMRHAREYDVVHIHALFSWPSLAAAASARWHHIPYLLRPLGTLNRWGMLNRRRWLKKLSFGLIESRILRGAAFVHYTSEQEAIEAQQLGVDHRCIVIPNPVDLPKPMKRRGEFRSLYPDLAAATVVLFLSRLDQKKGLDLLITAFARVRKTCPEAVLVVAGDGHPPFVAELKDLSRRLSLDAGILWAGFLQGEKKRAALADADIFVLPSYSENFGVAVVEAMGAGLPVIVSDQVGLHHEVTRANAGLVVQCTVESLESALVRTISDAGLRAEMGSNAIALAQHFAPGIIARELAEVYARIRSQHRRPTAA